MQVVGHCSGAILPLMQQAELVQCIKCEGDGYFIWKLPPLIAYMSLLPSSTFSPMALVICLKSLDAPREGRLPRFHYLDYLDCATLELVNSWAQLLLKSTRFDDLPSSGFPLPQ